jgi:alpha/beta superfamily hydrolase
MSVLGLMTYFLHYLIPQEPIDYSSEDDSPNYDLSPIQSHVVPAPQSHDYHQSKKRQTMGALGQATDMVYNKRSNGTIWSLSRTLILLGGYSYGSLITMSLPTISSVLEIFKAPELGTAASEIRLRAQQLASQQNEFFASYAAELQRESDNAMERRHKRGRSLKSNQSLSPRKISSGVRIGGEESNPELRRTSHDSRRSFSIDAPDRLRKSMDRVRSMGRRPNSAILSPKRHKSLGTVAARPLSSSSSTNSPTPVDGNNDEKIKTTMEIVELDELRACYLLVSPLQGLVHSLASMWTLPKSKLRSHSKTGDDPSEEICILASNDTLAVFGDRDVFTSSKKLRAWASELANREESRFQYVEINGAGHFWHEDGVVQSLKNAVEEFVGGL